MLQTARLQLLPLRENQHRDAEGGGGEEWCKITPYLQPD